MRCPDCQKFVSFDSETDPEVNVESVDEEGVVTGDVRIVNTCAECGTELKEASLDVEEDFSEEVAEHRKERKDAGEPDEDHDELTVETDDGSRFDEMQDTDRHGKKIKRARYMKHLYGAEVEITVECKCGEKFTRTWRDSVPGSSMEEMV
jgi:hypothetical protein